MTDKAKRKFTSVSIPTFLFEKIKERMGRSGFPSVSSYVAYVLREVLTDSQPDAALTRDNAEKVKERLRSLGYID